MPDASSPEYWRDTLTNELMKRRGRINDLEAYYNGDHPLPAPPKRLTPAAFEAARKSYVALMKMGVTNWVKLVADAPSERLEVVGFRSAADDGKQTVNREAWKIWQANDLDAQSMLVHDNALQTGQSFVMVDPFSGAITCEHSGQMIVAYAPGSRRDVVAALKLWDEDDGRWMATLILPNSVHKWHSANLMTPWSTRGDDDGATANPLGAVSVVEFPANPSLRPAMFGGGRGEFESVLPIQDRINKTIFDRLVTGEFQAFRQRYIVGWTPDVDPDSGLPKPDALQKAWESMLWTFDGDPADIKLGEFAQADFAGFIKAAESDVNSMAAISKTPPHYLLGAMVNISGDALTAAESGLTAKTRKHARNFGSSWEQVMRYAGQVANIESLAADTASQIIWGDIEHRTWGEQVDAVLKMQSLNVPTEALWARLPDVSPQDIASWRAMNEVSGILDAPVPGGDDGAA